jgi:hypothetical protein
MEGSGSCTDALLVGLYSSDVGGVFLRYDIKNGFMSGDKTEMSPLEKTFLTEAALGWLGRLL